VSGDARVSSPRAALLVSLLAAFGALAGCGQRGPLTLPGAEPAERSDSSTSPSGGATDAVPASTEATPGTTEPGSEDEDEPGENGR
jgi:predicted small lipoprotein YifL